MPEKFKLQIVGPEGRDTELVIAERVNDVFAIHRALGDKRFWQVSHIPTGWRLGSMATRENALAVIDHAITSAGINWKRLTRTSSLTAAIARKGKRFKDDMRERRLMF